MAVGEAVEERLQETEDGPRAEQLELDELGEVGRQVERRRGVGRVAPLVHFIPQLLELLLEQREQLRPHRLEAIRQDRREARVAWQQLGPARGRRSERAHDRSPLALAATADDVRGELVDRGLVRELGQRLQKGVDICAPRGGGGAALLVRRVGLVGILAEEHRWQLGAQVGQLLVEGAGLEVVVQLVLRHRGLARAVHRDVDALRLLLRLQIDEIGQSDLDRFGEALTVGGEALVRLAGAIVRGRRLVA